MRHDYHRVYVDNPLGFRVKFFKYLYKGLTRTKYASSERVKS